VSGLSDALASALSTLSSFESVTLGYRASGSGAFTTLTGFVHHKDRIPQAQYDERGEASIQSHTMIVKGPTTPVMVRGYQIQVGGSASDIWTVESVTIQSQQVILCRRTPILTLGPDRGEVR